MNIKLDYQLIRDKCINSQEEIVVKGKYRMKKSGPTEASKVQNSLLNEWYKEENLT